MAQSESIPSYREHSYISRAQAGMSGGHKPEAMSGVLVDVSGSMRNAFALDSSNDASVERVHAIITTVLNIVKTEVHRHGRQEEIFVSAFGLDVKVDACDLIALLELIAGPEALRGKNAYDALVALAQQNGAPHADRWIRNHLSEDEARDLYRVLCFDESLIPGMIRKLPEESGVLTGIATYVPGGNLVEGFAVHRSEAYCYAEQLIRDKDNIINRALAKIQHPMPRSVCEVSELLDDLNLREGPSASSESIHTRIRELIDPIKPYIFGGTPMRKAMIAALNVFRRAQAKKNVLFILSDGESADGNPRDIAQELHRLGVTTVTCFLTDGHIDNPKSLLDQAPPDWPERDGRLTLFEMSSTMRNIDPPVSYLVDAGWTLPASGESRLFVQANSLDVVDELCKTVISQLTNPCDALVDILEKVPLATYINQSNAEFEPKKQVGGTCYANAVAAVFHLAMHRIVGREGGYPDFYEIRDRLVREYGSQGASTRRVLEKVCPEYRLHFREVDETHARQAINNRRPVVATFAWYSEQKDKFKTFFSRSPKGILKRSYVGGGSTKPGGHAVVLIRCNPQCLVFMNSWGQGWGDGGFFRLEDAKVLDNMKFYDVDWTLSDLKQSEKEAYRQEGLKKAKELGEKFPSIHNLLFECPKCRRNSRVGDFKGDLLETTCPRCRETFKPKNEDLLKSLYIRNV